MSRLGHIIFSYSFDSQGKATKIVKDKVAEEIRNQGLSWVHLDGKSVMAAKWLQTKVNYLDNIIINALIAEETRPRVIEFPHGLLIILRGVGVEQENEHQQEMVSVRMWIDSERIITIQRRDMKSLFVLQKEVEEGIKLIENSGQFLNYLVNQTINDISDLVFVSSQKIDDVEQEILDTHNLKFREHILHTRSNFTTFRRYLTPQKETISRIRSCQYHWVDELTVRHFQENYDQINRVIDEVDEVLLRSKILHDELSHALNEKINRNMFKISFITMIFMPLTFITGFFGMNFDNIPGIKNPDGVYITSVLMIFVAVVQLFFFKRKDWF